MLRSLTTIMQPRLHNLWQNLNGGKEVAREAAAPSGTEAAAGRQAAAQPLANATRPYRGRNGGARVGRRGSSCGRPRALEPRRGQARPRPRLRELTGGASDGTAALAGRAPEARRPPRSASPACSRRETSSASTSTSTSTFAAGT